MFLKVCPKLCGSCGKASLSIVSEVQNIHLLNIEQRCYSILFGILTCWGPQWVDAAFSEGLQGAPSWIAEELLGVDVQPWSWVKPVNTKGTQPWIFIGRTDAEAEAPIFGHLMGRADSLEKTLMVEKIEAKRRGQQRMRWLGRITDSMDKNWSELREIVKDREDWCTAVHGFTELDTT